MNADQLTPREKEAARIAAAGCTNKEVAARMSLTEATVEQYLHRAFDKLQVGRRSELMYKAESLK